MKSIIKNPWFQEGVSLDERRAEFSILSALIYNKEGKNT